MNQLHKFLWLPDPYYIYSRPSNVVWGGRYLLSMMIIPSFLEIRSRFIFRLQNEPAHVQQIPPPPDVSIA